MRLDRYLRVDDFLGAAGEYLAAREAEHNLLLGIASTLRANPDAHEAPPYLAAVTDGGRVVAAALRTPPYNLLLSEVDDERALALLADDLEEAELPGVTGPPDAARHFAERRAAASGGSWRTEIEEGIYRLAEVIAPRPVGGRARVAVPGDSGLVERWLIEFGSEALEEDDAKRVRLGLEAWLAGRGKRYWLWEDGGLPVSLAGAGGETPHGIRIGPVYTPPEHRGQGYASNLVAEVSRLVLDEGRRFCFLYTNLANATANRIYVAMGYQRVGDAVMLAFATR